jgi:hypothetical protein
LIKKLGKQAICNNLKEIKFLRINLVEVKDLYNENYKSLKKEIEDIRR